MRPFRKCSRISILSLLVVSVFIPIFLLSHRLKYLNTDESKAYVEDLSIIKHRTEAQSLQAIRQEDGEGLKEPPLVVYKDKDFASAHSSSSLPENISLGRVKHEVDGISLLNTSGSKQQLGNENQHARLQENLPSTKGKSHSNRAVDEKVKEMKDQVIRAKAYLTVIPPNGNYHLVRELKQRIKENERIIGEASEDSDLPRRAWQKMRAMDAALLRASRIDADCSVMVRKLRAMTYNAEETLRGHKNYATYLLHLAGRTTPKGLHCLSMRLTSEYFALQPNERKLPNQHRIHDPDLYHFVVFSDNVLACSVVVNSTISWAKDQEKIVFHIVTDSLNHPALSMWFLMNIPGKATIEILNMDSFTWLSPEFFAILENQNSLDPKYTSTLNHIRFYLPEIFPSLKKVVLLDHDVVVQRDLSELWSINMKGKVNGAVETCQEDEPSFRRMASYIDFTDPAVDKMFDARTCTWAFGMNVFNLQEWRKRNLTGVYFKYLQLGSSRPLIKAGSLPIGWITFYGQTIPLNRKWHILGLGSYSGVTLRDIEQSAVIHYDGIMKPWLDIGIDRYKKYWKKYLNYDHPYLQQCNIHS